MFCQWRYILEQIGNKLNHQTAVLLTRINSLEEEIRQVRFIVSQPNRFSFVMIEENGMAIKFSVTLPVRPESDEAWEEIAFGELLVKIPGKDPILVQTTKEQQLTEDRELVDDRFVGAQDALVEGEFNYVDNAGNRGVKVSGSAVLVDNIPPVAPTALGFNMVDEVPDEPVA